MSNGRSERRIAWTANLEVCLHDGSAPGEEAVTENVSAHGARVLVERKLPPGQRVLIKSPTQGIRSQGRIVYCQRVAESQRVADGKFAVGLELSSRVVLWARSY